MNIVCVLIGGAVGSLCRYGSSIAADRLFGGKFPFGTLIVNLVGCFLIGAIVGYADRAIVPKPLTLFLVTGFLGGLTTFSSFSLASVRLLQSNPGMGFANLFLNVAGGFGLTLLGLWLAERS